MTRITSLVKKLEKMKKIEDMVKEIEKSCLDIIGHDDQDEDEIPDPLNQRSKTNM
ncbi:hypothetical protein CTI12_AA254140 [Artemisia annua]|uniref:Uncharacterized protein n=1 Tax=Artemisia annua TaxID=35608 RepID=A0A2U1NLB1_ARTAN|nr:hypothetical protein CTI12_AA254140 [Artemisia annua]